MHHSWQAVKLGDISKVITSGSRGWAGYYSDEGAKFIRMTNLGRNGIGLLLNDLKYVRLPANNSEGSRTLLRPNDILISITAELGKIGYVPENLGESYINQHVALVRLDEKKVIPKMVAYVLSTTRARNELNRRNDAGAKSGLNLTTIQNFPILVPNRDQQVHIVKILETWDKCLELLDKKITLKSNIKKGLSQNLLCGAIRLQGFADVWQDFTIEGLCEIKKGSGLSKEKLSPNGTHKCILYGELYTKYDEIIDNVISRTNLNEGIRSKSSDVLIPASTTTSHLDLAIAASVKPDNILLGGDINILRPKQINSYNSDFLAYYLTNIKRHELARLAQGITIVHLYGKDFKKLQLSLPSHAEQTEIVKVLVSAELEIESLKIARNLIAAQKRYLLSDLVSGKIHELGSLSTKKEEAIHA